MPCAARIGIGRCVGIIGRDPLIRPFVWTDDGSLLIQEVRGGVGSKSFKVKEGMRTEFIFIIQALIGNQYLLKIKVFGTPETSHPGFVQLVDGTVFFL